jgi:chemotaxis signal transduction protein
MRLVTENGEEDFRVGVLKPMTETLSPAVPSRFLIVTLGERYLALDAESIRGLLTLEEARYMEDPTIQGLVYRAIHLADRLSVSHDQDGANTRVVLLSEREARGSIRVTMVHGQLDLRQSQVLPLPLQFRGEERHWYRGMILFEHSIALVLNTAWLLDEQLSELDSNGESDHTPQLVAAPKDFNHR